MIVVKVELHSARTGQIKQIGELHIINQGGGQDDPVADYKGLILRKPDFKDITREGEVRRHRKRDLTVWHLIAKMLTSMGYVHRRSE